MTNPNPPPAVVLFDMGGVLIELGPMPELLGLPMSEAAFWPAWLTSEAVRAFESGMCNELSFAQSLIAEFELEVSNDEIIERFRAVPRGLYPGAAELVRQAGQYAKTGVLSNTNALHWEHQIDADIVSSLFDYEYLSYRLGTVKPDREIFDHAVADLQVRVSSIVFLDDNQINVDGARSVGIDAYCTKGPQEARAALVELDLLAD